MNPIELYLLGRTLMKIGEEALPVGDLPPLAVSTRSVLLDVFQHRRTTIGEITTRTGFPQSHVSASVARLREGGVVVTAVDPSDRRRTLVQPAAGTPLLVEQIARARIDDALAAALDTDQPEQVAQVLACLDSLARHLLPRPLRRLRTEPASDDEPWTMTKDHEDG